MRPTAAPTTNDLCALARLRAAALDVSLARALCDLQREALASKAEPAPTVKEGSR